LPLFFATTQTRASSFRFWNPASSAPPISKGSGSQEGHDRPVRLFREACPVVAVFAVFKSESPILIRFIAARSLCALGMHMATPQLSKSWLDHPNESIPKMIEMVSFSCRKARGLVEANGIPQSYFLRPTIIMPTRSIVP